ncbi:MAG: hypothetical protein WB755_21155, partial [Terriglobales bacterium]|jgi:hypothetical protein
MHPFFEYVERNWEVLKTAPLAFVLLTCLAGGFGVVIGSWHYSERIQAQDQQLGRYRVALGIDPASKGALVELNNEELALKTQSTVLKLRQLSSALDKKNEGIDRRLNTGEITSQQALADRTGAMKEISHDFDNSLASDAFNLENELRTRLDKNAISHVIRVPGFIEDGNYKAHFSLADLLRGTGLDSTFIGRLADELEQMAKLLPHDSRKP